MRPLVRSYGVISTSTLSPVSTRMRFLRMRPAVWAMISCSFSSLTRNIALGSNSVTTPGNSSTSSFGIRYLRWGTVRRRRPDRARNLYEWSRWNKLFAGWPYFRIGEALADARFQPVAHIAIGGQNLLPRAAGAGRIGGRPVFHI